ncbi:MAG: hypothetical protein Q7J33_00775 [Serpentinimonas sp.]|nr:hypothetical protein [Serpentinimonas sp.]
MAVELADLVVRHILSLSADSVRLTDSETFELGIPFNAPISYYPAVKLTKLATTSGLQSQGLGQAMGNRGLSPISRFFSGQKIQKPIYFAHHRS